MKLGNPIVQFVARPVQRGWLLWSRPTWAQIARPTDDPVVTVAGDAAARVLLIGDGPTLGMGVTSHELALPGHLARQVAKATGRGVEVSVIADNTLTVLNIVRRYEARRAGRYDVVVVMIGTSDSIRITPVRQWMSQVGALLDEVSQDGASAAVLVGVPPVDRLLFLRGLPAVFAARHADLLNRASAELCATRANTTFLPFAPPAEPDGERHRSSKTYGRWAAVISPAIAAALKDSALGAR